MSKSNKKYQRKRVRPFPWMPVVLGMLLIGFAVLSLASQNSGGPAADLSSVVPVKVSFAAPELSLQNINGQTESLADYRDHIVLVNNWATWCPPCKAEMPTLAAYYNEHSEAGFMIIAIEAGDPADGVSKFAQSYRFDFPVWLDPNGASLKAFGNGTLPNSYVIDRSGTVRYAWTGEISRAMLEESLTEFRQLGDKYFENVALRFIGILQVRLDNLTTGVAALREALILARSLDSKYEVAAALRCIGDAAQVEGNLTRAVRLHWAARSIFDSIGAWRPEDDTKFEIMFAPYQTVLGISALTTAIEEGRAMTFEQAIDYALFINS